MFESVYQLVHFRKFRWHSSICTEWPLISYAACTLRAWGLTTGLLLRRTSTSIVLQRGSKLHEQLVCDVRNEAVSSEEPTVVFSDCRSAPEIRHMALSPCFRSCAVPLLLRSSACEKDCRGHCSILRDQLLSTLHPPHPHPHPLLFCLFF